jgi:UDP:flavonoid glycosyltransferase YjiC (YdhE family)
MKLMQSNCVERIGAGAVIGTQRDPSTIASAIGEVLQSTQYRTRARAFAQKYVSFDSSASAKGAAQAVLRLVGEQPRRH